MKAICLLSGGLDSTVTLAYALHRGFEVTALTINYGQRHKRELDAAKAVAAHYKVPHIIMQFPLTGFRSALTDESIPVPDRKPEEIGYDIPETYVPARNIVFLSIAAGLAESVDASSGVHRGQLHRLSGYPDCRPGSSRPSRTCSRWERRGVLGTRCASSIPYCARSPRPRSSRWA